MDNTETREQKNKIKKEITHRLREILLQNEGIDSVVLRDQLVSEFDRKPRYFECLMTDLSSRGFLLRTRAKNPSHSSPVRWTDDPIEVDTWKRKVIIKKTHIKDVPKPPAMWWGPWTPGAV